MDLDRPHILVAHPLTTAAEAVAALLAEQRPRYAVRLLAPAELDTALTAAPAPIVVCGEPSLAVQRRARGWIALLPAGQNVALVGVGDEWRVLHAPPFAQVVAAVDDLLARTAAPVQLDAALG